MIMVKEELSEGAACSVLMTLRCSDRLILLCILLVKFRCIAQVQSEQTLKINLFMA